ncbi:anillin-like isoform X2 [Dendronephthya gigantea]|uniref:anillin-like isoform X2 n=1 Tax=Dendronephthya gigantea TaxID=151771 RepID=UPI00106A858D|nr:anillin-like isoform X2 [Dendronephthya gigantea]
MDPFTEKLLARTQARKAALAKKREEVASRSPVVTPRRPLSENKNSGSTPVKNGPAVSTTPIKPPTVVKTTEHVAGTPKTVFYEKFAKQASLQQKECFIELNDAKNALKPTPKKRNIDDKGLTNLEKVASDEPKLKKALKDEVVNMDSPSVKDRKALYMKQVQEGAAPAKVSPTPSQVEKPLQLKPVESEKVFPSVKEPRSSLAGGRFFHDPRNNPREGHSKHTTDTANKTTPVKPPRVTVTAKLIEPEQITTSTRKISDGAPVKPPRASQGNPPSKPPRVQISESQNNDGSETKGKDKVKQSSVSIISLKRPAPVPPTDDEVSGESIQRASKRCEVEVESDIPAKKSTLEKKNDTKTDMALETKDTVSTPSKDLLAPPTGSCLEKHNAVSTVNESTPTHEGKSEDFKRTLKSQKISAISLNDMDTSLNSHEITFNISMTGFDQVLEEDKKDMFQMTYDESVKKAEESEMSCSNHDAQLDDEMIAPVQATFKGVHKSGYHSSNSDQYAATVTPKAKKVRSTSTRKFTVHEKIQMMLEEAAYQQNIVLQASQAVNTCLALHEGVSTGSSEEVEAERLLRFSTERRTACLDEVQKLKSAEEDDAVSVGSEDMDEDLPCKATLNISGIKLPVDKKMLPNKNSSEPCIYSFICILKHTPKQMYCTKAVSSNEIKNGCITFDDEFEIKNVKPSFTLDIQIFVLKTQLPLVLPQNKNRKKSMITKRKGSDGTPQGVTPGTTQGPVFRTSGFTLSSTTHIDLENIHNQKYQMQQVDERFALIGDIHLEIECKPEYTNQAKGFLTIFEDVGGLGDWLRYWCILDGSVLKYWKYPDDDLIKPPIGSIDLDNCISESVTIVRRDICARPHTMQLVLEKPQTASDRETLIAVNAGGKMLIKYMLSADTKADKVTWLNTINESLKDWRAWHHNTGMAVNSDVILV